MSSTHAILTEGCVCPSNYCTGWKATIPSSRRSSSGITAPDDYWNLENLTFFDEFWKGASRRRVQYIDPLAPQNSP